MIWRIRERSAVARVSRDGRRLRSGDLWCTCLIDPEASPPRVAFAIGRAVGTSVVRNQLRRRLRELLSDSQLPAGWYLVGARPGAAARSFVELSSAVSSLVTQAAQLPVTNVRSLNPDVLSDS